MPKTYDRDQCGRGHVAKATVVPTGTLLRIRKIKEGQRLTITAEETAFTLQKCQREAYSRAKSLTQSLIGAMNAISACFEPARRGGSCPRSVPRRAPHQAVPGLRGPTGASC